MLPTNEVNKTDPGRATTINENTQSRARDDKVRGNEKISVALESTGRFTKIDKRNTYETEKLRNHDRADSTIDYVKLQNNNNKLNTHPISVYTVEIRNTAMRENNLDDKSKLNIELRNKIMYRSNAVESQKIVRSNGNKAIKILDRDNCR